MSSSFEDLEVWEKSCRLAVHQYELLRDCRDYGIRDQMMRASVIYSIKCKRSAIRRQHSARTGKIKGKTHHPIGYLLLRVF